MEDKMSVALEYLKVLRNEIDTRYRVRWTIEAIKIASCTTIASISINNSKAELALLIPFARIIFDIIVYFAVAGIFSIG